MKHLPNSSNIIKHTSGEYPLILKQFLLLTVLFISSLLTSLKAESLNLVTVDFPPYSFSTRTEIKGIEVDIIKRAMEIAGISYTLELMPFPRALHAVETMKKDFIFNFYQTPERLKKFDYTTMIVENPLVLFVKKNSSITFTGNIEELGDYTIGVMIGYTYSPVFDKKRHFLRIEEASSHENNFQKLAAGRIDIYIAEKTVGKHVIQQLQLQNEIKNLSVPLIVQNGYMGISKNNPNRKLIGRINAAIQKMRASGEIAAIFAKYLQ